MSKRLLILGTLAIFALMVPPQAFAQEEQAAKQKPPAHDPVGYFLGISVGQQLRQSGFRAGDFDMEGLIAGLKHGLDDQDAALTDDQLRDTQTKIQSLLQARQAEAQKEQAEMAKIQKQKGETFLADNATQQGVKTLEGGVQYKVIAAGTGESPTPTDTVKVHYTGKLIDGTTFDSSIKRGEPATFRVNQVIQGWQMALQQMKVGDKWMLYIPSDLAYGERGSQGAIGPNEVLIFEVELLAIQ